MTTLEKDVPVKAEPAWRKSWWLGGGLVVLIVVVGFVWGSLDGGGHKATGSEEVSSSTLTPWPFTVKSGVLRCEGNAVTFTAGGVEYALNGSAIGRGFPQIYPVWAPDPSVDDLHVALGPALKEGLALC